MQREVSKRYVLSDPLRSVACDKARFPLAELTGRVDGPC